MERLNIFLATLIRKRFKDYFEVSLNIFLIIIRKEMIANKSILENALILAKCGFEKCEIEHNNLIKLKNKYDLKMSKLYDQNTKITEDKLKKEILKINSQFHKSKENLKMAECQLKNCSEFIKKQLLFMIDNLNIKFKDNKERLNKLKTYKKLFNKKEIDIKYVHQFYKEFI
jgi:hypothetical protein